MVISLRPIILKRSAVTPAAPPAGHCVLYSITGQVLLMEDDAGVVRPVDASLESLPFSQPGALTVRAGSARFPIAGGTFEIVSVAAMVGTAPTGTSIIVDVNKNGITIFGTQGNRPTIAIGANNATTGAHSVSSVTTNDYLAVDVDQIGSTVPGSDLVVVIRLQRIA